MDCPKCTGKLEENKLGDETIDVCWVCEGIWFDRGELKKVISGDSKDFKSIGSKLDLEKHGVDGAELAAFGIDLNHKEGKCPRCADVMGQTVYKKGILIDSCPKDHGIWLDGGEIHKLRERGFAGFIESLKFSFSEEGFRTLVGKIKGK